MKDYDVVITETLKMKVTVEAENMDEAIQKTSDAWRNGEYILDADCFDDVTFEPDDPNIELSYREMADIFTHVNKIGHEPVCGYIVFDQSSFDKVYSEQSRTYGVSSDNKAYQPGMGGYSIYASCLDGTDQCIRLDGYMRGEKPWKIEKCYMEREVYNELLFLKEKNEKENVR